MIRTVHVVIIGRVQGVGYRAWTEEEAVARGLSGWVRNRRDGAVEAVLSGTTTIVDEMIAACRSGPRLAVVEEVRIVDLPSEGLVPGFHVRTTS
ncbi:acylphosphatase [Rhizobiales bacterium GAS113]|nr:acylphosphatase [Rhizobiales bacterium GAS113]